MITAIVDLQFGSTGKGLIAGYLSQKNDYDLVVSANMPNAGHTFVDNRGKKWINKVLPSGVYSQTLQGIAIGPGAVFSPEQLVKEIGELRGRGVFASLFIHPNAAIVAPEHAEAERQTLSPIGSTMQGSMEALVQKMRRDPENMNIAGKNKTFLTEYRTADGCTLAAYVLDHREWVGTVNEAKNILMEGSQGYSLGLNSEFYPYCTSRDCTVWRLLSDCGLSVAERLKVIGTARVHPIRVGNTPDGYSGAYYPDQAEVSWQQIGVEPELTTVTKRERRVFTFSDQQVAEAIRANRVDEVFLNFCNYDVRQAILIQKRINEMYRNEFRVQNSGFGSFATEHAPSAVRYMGFGPQAEDILEVGHSASYPF